MVCMIWNGGLLEYCCVCLVQEIGFTHMKICEGVASLLQLSGLLARLCLKVQPST